MLEGGTEDIAAGFTVQTEGVRVAGDGVPIGEDQDQRGGKFVEDLADCSFHGWGDKKFNFAPCLSRAVIERRRADRFSRSLRQ